MSSKGIWEQREFYNLLDDYLQLPIEEALNSQNVLFRAFAMIDRRLGKRKLDALIVYDNVHPLAKNFHVLRCHAEGIKPNFKKLHYER